MRRFPTVSQAEREINSLMHYVELASSYSPKNVEELIVHLYAETGSTKTVVDEINGRGYDLDDKEYSAADISTILRKPCKDDEFRSIVRSGFINNRKIGRNK